MVSLCKERRHGVILKATTSMSRRLNVVGDELLEALPLVENIKPFWL